MNVQPVRVEAIPPKLTGDPWSLRLAFPLKIDRCSGAFSDIGEVIACDGQVEMRLSWPPREDQRVVLYLCLGDEALSELESWPAPSHDAEAREAEFMVSGRAMRQMKRWLSGRRKFSLMVATLKATINLSLRDVRVKAAKNKV